MITISFGGNNSLEFWYDAMGNKVRKIVKTAGTTTLTHDYLGGIEVKNNKVDAIYSGVGRAFNTASSGQAYRYEYYLKDHLGNIRLSFTDKNNDGRINNQGEILQENQYYPFGMVQHGSWYDDATVANNPYLYNDKELTTDFGLNLSDYGARGYDAAIGRWWQVDPLAHKMPFASPYNYCLNNPINMIDPDGRIPYPITIRGFAPFKEFGFGFHGDGRGYSTGNVSARVHQKINFDTDKTTMTTTAWSSPTWKTSDPSNSKPATPSVNFTGDFTIKQNGDAKTFGFGSHVAAANPLTPPGTPNIDIFSNFSITENKKAGTLSISGSLKGDNFPSTEAFITDPAGSNLFIGIGQIAAGVDKDWGPLTQLPFENKRPITSFNFTVTTDKDGNFTGVQQGKTTYTLEAWNKLFTSKPTQKTE